MKNHRIGERKFHVNVVEMDIDDYFLEGSLELIDDEQCVHNP